MDFSESKNKIELTLQLIAFISCRITDYKITVKFRKDF